MPRARAEQRIWCYCSNPNYNGRHKVSPADAILHRDAEDARHQLAIREDQDPGHLSDGTQHGDDYDHDEQHLEEDVNYAADDSDDGGRQDQSGDAHGVVDQDDTTMVLADEEVAEQQSHSPGAENTMYDQLPADVLYDFSDIDSDGNDDHTTSAAGDHGTHTHSASNAHSDPSQMPHIDGDHGPGGDYSSSDESISDELADLDLENYIGVEGWNDPTAGRLDEEELIVLRNDLELVSWQMHSGISSRAIDNRPASLSTGNPMSRRTVKEIKQVLRNSIPPFRMQTYTCCIDHHMAFTGRAADGETRLACVKCGKTERGEFWYTRLHEVIKADFAIPAIAERRHLYMQQMRADKATLDDLAARGQDGSFHMRDFWHGQHARSTLDFSAHDVAYAFSTDGVEVGKETMWPITLTNLTDPPWLRYKLANVTIVGFVPGNISDIGSFLEPLVDDLKELSETGLRVYDSYLKRHVTVKVHLSVVSADTPAMSKLIGLKGSNATKHCRFCEIVAYYCRVIGHSYYPSFRGVYSIDSLPAPRQDLKGTILRAISSLNAQTMRDNGVASLSPFTRLGDDLDWPGSFGLDGMHLFTNVAKLVVDVYFKHPDLRLTPAQRDIIASALHKAGSLIPTSVIQRRPRSWNDRIHWTSVEWQAFTTQLSIPLFYAVGMPDAMMSNWKSFVEGVQLALRVELTKAEIDRMEWCFQRFVAGFEELYVRWDPLFDPATALQQEHEEGVPSSPLPRPVNIKLCTSQLHGLLHFAQCVRILGPAFVFWQYATERIMGTVQSNGRRYQGKSCWLDICTRRDLQYARHIYSLVDRVQRASSSTGETVVLGRYACLSRKDRSRTAVVSGQVRSLLQPLLAPTSAESAPLEKWKKIELFVKTGTTPSFEICVQSRDAATAAGQERPRNCIEFADRDELRYGRVIEIVYHPGMSRAFLVVRPFVLWDAHGGLLDYEFAIGPPLPPQQTAYPATSAEGTPVIVDAANVTGPVGMLECPVSRGDLPRRFIVKSQRIEALVVE